MVGKNDQQYIPHMVVKHGDLKMVIYHGIESVKHHQLNKQRLPPDLGDKLIPPLITKSLQWLYKPLPLKKHKISVVKVPSIRIFVSVVKCHQLWPRDEQDETSRNRTHQPTHDLSVEADCEGRLEKRSEKWRYKMLEKKSHPKNDLHKILIFWD